jgi:hypothetical protein
VRYFCVTHKAIPWRLPSFMTVVGSGADFPAGGLDLSVDYSEQTGRHVRLGEYGPLFAVRRLLESAHETGLVGLSHYRRFPVTRTVGEPDQFMQRMDGRHFQALADEVFLPGPGVVLAPIPVNFGMPVIAQYATHHAARDLLFFFGLAVDLGVIGDGHAGAFLAHPAFRPTPSVGIFPAPWLISALTGIEQVCDAFEAAHVVDRDGYQRRAMGFCCERLHSLLLEIMLADWPAGSVNSQRVLVISDEDALSVTV